MITTVVQLKDMRLGLILALFSHSWSSESEFPGRSADGRVSQVGMVHEQQIQTHSVYANDGTKQKPL